MKYTLILFTALSLSLAATAQDAMSVWTTQPVTLDGRPYEWPSFFRFYAPGTKFQFDILNDSANIYICVRATEIEAQARLMHAGLTIWVDPTGKKKQKEGFEFPMKLEHSAGEGPMGEEPTGRSQDPGSMPSLRSRVNRLRERVILSQVNIKTRNLAGVTEPLLSLTNKYGLDVAYGWDSLDILYIEYRIPLALVLGRPVISADYLQPIGIGLVSGSVEIPARGNGGPNDPMSTGGGTGGRGGRGGGQGMGSGGRPGGMTGQGSTMSGSYNPNAAEQKTWLKLHLETGKQ
jgi:hypothetical protein